MKRKKHNNKLVDKIKEKQKLKMQKTNKTRSTK